MLLPCSSGLGVAAVTATLAPAACTARPSLPARRSSSFKQAVTAAAAHKQQACIATVPAAGVQQRTASCSIPALQDVQRAAALHSRHPAACRAFSSGISTRSRSSRHGRQQQQLAVRCQAVDPGGETLGSSSSSSSTGNGGGGNGYSNGGSSSSIVNGSSSSSSSGSGSSLDASTPPDVSPAALATMEGAAAMAAATIVQTAAEASSSFASVSTADTDSEADAGAVGADDADADAAAAAAVSAESPDVLCQVDELDTPEALTDVQYSAPSPSGRRFSSSYTPGTWQGDDEDEPQDAAFGSWKNRDDLITLAYAVAMGGVVATSVFCFDVAIQYVHDLPDIFSQDLHLGGGRATGLVFGETAIPFRCVMPIGAGFVVAYLQKWGFSPALKFLTRAIEGVVDDSKNAAYPTSYWQVFRRAAASVVTLGSGASLGPEAPSVELGANTAAVLAPKHLSKRRQRMLVAAGAAAGVSAAFDAPATGALFAIEFVLKSSRLGLDRLSTSTVFAATSVSAGVVGFLRGQGQALGITGAATHLVGRIPYFSVNPNLLTDVLQFSVLGVGCAGAAVLLYEGIRVSEVVLRPLPRWASAPLGGALCGLIAFKFPQVQYGYINLEEIFRDSTRLSVVDLSSLLLAKIAATSVCVGGGLVGGLFAPSLFIGALVGDIMGHFVANTWGVADPTTLVVVGAAAVLGAACRAPLTAFGLMVEITRDTGLFVPLLAAVGVASLVSEYAEGVFSQQFEQALTNVYFRERILFWGAGGSSSSAEAQAAAVCGGAADATAGAGGGGSSSGTTSSSGGAWSVGLAVKPQPQLTVESVIATPAKLYVRHTLPLEQAKEALAARASAAAVVVDDNFTPMGIVYLEDIEAELVKQQLLNQPTPGLDK